MSSQAKAKYKCTICNELFEPKDFVFKYRCCKTDFRFSFMDEDNDDEDPFFSNEDYVDGKDYP